MKNRHIVVVGHDPAWEGMFHEEAGLLRAALGDGCGVVAVHHIGSTAVPGLRAKPIIDMLLEVGDVRVLDEAGASPRMERLGYHAWGEYGIEGRRYFTKGGPEGRTHHVHAFGSGDANLDRHLAFRDYLRAHPAVAQAYGELKSRVAAMCDHDIDVYCDGKDAFVKRHEALAVAWWRG